eukprot:TRINITY_DN4859_c0_g1_i5.p2 TRINITY_DN4859_c0_g1~~TRINITY_DN4859_c0_g1_i5.p2  ORF type:complete len:181 (-),score=33.35 TRINITY_DN4859_c0_g1_i5:38-580(-)
MCIRDRYQRRVHGMELILISGLSGSGKSVALNLLEDSGYYCVDNLPVIMLTVLAGMLKEEGIKKTAVAIDARSGHGIDLLASKMERLTKSGINLTFLFLHSTEETLLKRYSESRRRHPLASADQTLVEAIRAERDLQKRKNKGYQKNKGEQKNQKPKRTNDCRNKQKKKRTDLQKKWCSK